MATAASAPPLAGNARSSALRRLQRTDVVFHNLTFACAVSCPRALGRRRDFTVSWRLACYPRVRLLVPDEPVLEPGDRKIWRPSADLWHDHHVNHCNGHRRSNRTRHCNLLDRNVPESSSPSDWYRNRTARRHSKHNLRHLGTLRPSAPAANDCAAGSHRDV